MLKVKRALISVSDKSGIVKFAQGLSALGVEILSTGGTASKLKESGINVIEVSDYTGFPEMLDGRVKTLHPKIHGGLLALREKPEHIQKLKEHGIGLIDMAVVNLYPFENVIQKKKVSLEEAIENIDIGGPAMLRSAAKNFKNVAVICNPAKYQNILDELNNNNGLLSDSVLYNLALEAFSHTARYDGIISGFLSKRTGADEFSQLPKEIQLKFVKVQDLRYGENPHQKGAFYRDDPGQKGLANLKQLGGKELSFNNILDLNAAVDFLKCFAEPLALIIKHNNPTGISQDASLEKAYKSAFACDPLSAFGGIIGFNRKVDLKTAQAISKSGFMECVIAPSFDGEALSLLSEKKNLRLIELDLSVLPETDYDLKRINGGILFQDRDDLILAEKDLKVVSKKKPTKQQLASMMFGWKVVKNVKSNAVVMIKGTKAVGIGCGQTSRVDSVKSAILKAGENAKGAILVSEAFIPKTDNIQSAAKAGIKAIMQSGGSIADGEVIKAADKAKICMVFTGVRHFKH
ncbi:MAG: bifunctional phosphoribosylaminoimidazolecarboxamide formyltransferase/IMP cyclohydrolase [Candidatus Omnitrophica bacterium]|nr:bifunctional phosphoribosylaminoimidazolecarboxamide formyltransferase/IMP cyclohydrolase [Candidatus Omnitrophota bacterium]